MNQKKPNPCLAYPTDAILLEALKKRIEQAMTCFYERNYKKLLPSLIRKGANRADAEDAFQDGVIAFLKVIYSFESRAMLDTFLHTVVNNRWKDIVRRGRRSTDLDQAPTTPAPDDPFAHLLNADVQTRIRAAIGKLDPRSQQLMDLLLFRHYSAKEAADELGITVESVHNQKSRCLKYLRKLMPDAPL